jgi:hypothetical protein
MLFGCLGVDGERGGTYHPGKTRTWAFHMGKFYDSLPERERTSPHHVALEYGRTLRSSYTRLLQAKATSPAPYYVGLSSELGSFTHVSKRVALVADTMLLSDHGVGAVHELGSFMTALGAGMPGGEDNVLTTNYGMVTKVV